MVRLLCPTQPGISTSAGLHAVINDLVQTSVNGIEVITADGEKVLLFIDAVGYICDYHEDGAVLDVVGSSGNAPCHLCSFQKFMGNRTIASKFEYSTNIHSSSPYFARNGIITEALRIRNKCDSVYSRNGLTSNAEALRKNNPLIKLFEDLRTARDTSLVPKTEKILPVVNPRFDPYRSTLAAPYHLFAGLVVNIITLCFQVLPSRIRRRQAGSLLHLNLSFNDLIASNKIYNMQRTFCILLACLVYFLFCCWRSNI